MKLLPFVHHQIHTKGYNTEAEKNIYDFILDNWLNCVPQYGNADLNTRIKYSLKGYLIVSKEAIQSSFTTFINI
jgi:hypothetical protein